MRPWAPRASAEPGYLTQNEAIGAESEASKVPEARVRKGLLCRRLGCGQGHDWASHSPLGPPSLAAPSLGPLAHTEHFPTGYSARHPTPAHTLCGWGVLLQGGISSFFICLAPFQTDVSFYFGLPENRPFLFHYVPGEASWGRGRQDECGTLGTLSTEGTVTFLPQQ